MQHWQKDRMKLVISTVYTLFCLILILPKELPAFFVFMLPIIVYWGYRWTKGDITFKNPNKNNP